MIITMFTNFSKNVKKNKNTFKMALNDDSTKSTKSNSSTSTSNIKLSDHLQPTKLESPLDGIQRAYYLNMPTSTERKNHMNTVLKHTAFTAKNGIPTFHIKAIDGRDPNFKVSDYFEFYSGVQKNPRMMNSEYATTLSHIKAIHQFARDVEEYNLPYESIALIMEDDISMEFVDYWPKSVNQLIADAEYSGSLPSNWEVLQLSYCLFATVPSGKPAEPWHMRKNFCGIIAYFIRYSAAVRLIEYLCKFSNPSDSYCKYYIGPEFPYYHHADRFLYSFFNTFTLNPPLFTYRDSNDSNIHPDHLDYHAKSKERTKRMWIGWDASEDSVK